MTKLTYSDSPFFSNWSQTYFTNLTLDEHITNNKWFMIMLDMLKDDGKLYVPMLDKWFNKLGKEVTSTGVELEDVNDSWYDENGDLKYE